MKEEDLVKDKELKVSYSHPRASGEVDEPKSYKFVEDFCFRGAGDAGCEPVTIGKRRNLAPLVLHGTLQPKEGSGAAPMAFEVPVSKWRMYRYRDGKCSGICVHSISQQVYRLGKPSQEYEPLIKSLMTCVGYAKEIQLFMVDVVGTDDMEGNEDLRLEFLLDMMTGSGLDRDFITQHGSEMFELLCELQVEKTLPFMVELKAMKPGKVSKPASKPQAEGGASKSKKKEVAASSAAGVSSHATAKPASGSAYVTQPTVKKCAAAGQPKGDVKPAAACSPSAASPAELEAADKKKRKRKPAPPKGNLKDDGSPVRPTTGAGNAGELSAGSGKMPASSPGQPSPLKVAPETLRLSEALPRHMSSLRSHTQRLARMFESDTGRLPTEESVKKVLKEVDGVLKSMDKEPFEPLQYLLADTYGGDDFFHPLFDLYRGLKRCHYLCAQNASRDMIARLRKHLIEHYTQPVLRDVWYIKNRGELAAAVREMKDGEKEVWKEAKRKRLEAQRVEERKQRAVLREQQRADREKLRAEQEIRRKAWEVAHEERKKQRLEAKAAAGGDVAMEVDRNKRPAEDEGEDGARKRTAIEGAGGLQDSDLQTLNEEQPEEQGQDSATTSPRTSTSGGSDSNDHHLSDDPMDPCENETRRAIATAKKTATAAPMETLSKVLVDSNGNGAEKAAASL